MRKFWFASAALIAFSGSMFADTIWSGSTGSLTGGPTFATSSSLIPYTGTAFGTNTQVPFWNNPSQDTTKDGNYSNVGDVLGGLATGTNLIGGNLTGAPSTSIPNTSTSFSGTYYASGSGNGDPVSSATPTSVSGLGSETVVPSLEFSFMSQGTALQVAILFADSGQNGTTVGQATSFGTYILTSGGCGTNCQFTPTVISSAVNNNTSGIAGTAVTDPNYSNTTVYGYYATVCYQYVSGSCTSSITYTTGAGNFSNNISGSSALLGALDWNHFAYFELANGEMVFGFEDSPWALTNSNAVEGIGDFNDVVFAVTGNPLITSAAPEPGTIAIMGLGLAGLGLIGRRRAAKK
jgi:hypothetical protein